MLKRLLIILILLATAPSVYSIERFPPPEFEVQYQMPKTSTPDAIDNFGGFLDVCALTGALMIAAYLIHHARSRALIFTLMLFCLAYFGFYRQGCLCAIGAIGNVTLAIFSPSYTIPIASLLIFLIPLFFALFLGRVFCSGICPLGAIQDVVLVKHLRLPKSLDQALSMGPYIYLAAAIVMAATSTGFIICRYDPFVGFFRISGNFAMIVTGGILLLIAMFVGRPYCRFICPYSVLLRICSRFSKTSVKITAGQCINCDLCQGSCAFNAIEKANPDYSKEDYDTSKKRLGILLLLLPIIIALFALAGMSISSYAAKTNPNVQLADRIKLENTGQAQGLTDESKAFRSQARNTEELYALSDKIQKQFAIGCTIAGAFIGLIAALKLITLSIRFKRDEYTANPASCLACARCYKYCPVKKEQNIK